MKKTRFHFVCDLRDQINSRGVRALRQVVMILDSPKELHVISYRNSPGDLIQQLIDDSGGTFTLIN